MMREMKVMTWQSHALLVLLCAFKNMKLVVDLNWSRTWCNFCTRKDIFMLYLMRILKLQNFLKFSDTYTQIEANTDYVRLTLFPLSLLGKANKWLNSELANSITSWDDLAKTFLRRIFQFGKTTKLRSDILSFWQKGGENLYQEWDMFKSTLLSYPHPNLHWRLESNTKILHYSVARG